MFKCFCLMKNVFGYRYMYGSTTCYLYLMVLNLLRSSILKENDLSVELTRSFQVCELFVI